MDAYPSTLASSKQERTLLPAAPLRPGIFPTPLSAVSVHTRLPAVSLRPCPQATPLSHYSLLQNRVSKSRKAQGGPAAPIKVLPRYSLQNHHAPCQGHTCPLFPALGWRAWPPGSPTMITLHPRPGGPAQEGTWCL